MATPPPASTALADSEANLTALQSTADTNFISDATIAINNAIALGQEEVRLHVEGFVNIQNIFNYFVGQGYVVSFPSLGLLPKALSLPSSQPAEQFGFFWEEFWLNFGAFIGPPVQPPTDIVITWMIPGP